ncbi:MAG: hypothetical protein ACYTF5_21920, partial [Planctomycetota bacterium]
MFRFHPSTFRVAVVAATATLTCAPAEAQNTKVVPASATSTEAPSNSYFPFVYNNTRVQQVWNGPDVVAGVALINSINFRRDGSGGAFPKIDIPKIVVSIGHTSVSPLTMSTTFAANITSTMTTLVNGKYSLPAQPTVSSPPAAFNIKYPASKPFIYNRQTGHLIMEWIIGSGAATNKVNYILDAIRYILDAIRTTTGGGGNVTPFGSWGKFAGNDPAKWSADANKLVPGGAAAFSLTGFNQAYTSKLFVGVSNTIYQGLKLPYDLGNIGAPGNFLYTGLDLILPFTLQKTPSAPSYSANLNFPLPNDNKLIGLKAYAQTYYGDSKANAAGLVASDALTLTVGSGTPTTQTLGQQGTTMATGFFL